MGDIVVVEELVKKYGDFTAVNHLNFTMKEGSIYGFLGPNGAGKSTTLSIIATLLRFNKGNVMVDGLDIRKNKGRVRQLLGWVPQEIVLYPKMSIKENIRFYGSLYGLKGWKLDEACHKALKVVSLDEMTNRKVFSLSGGMQRRLNIACGIVHQPRLIIMDEPTVGVDAQSRDLIIDSIKTLNQEGSSIIYTSHYMHEVEELCEEIGIVNKGQMVASGTYKELSKEYADSKTFQVESTKEAIEEYQSFFMNQFQSMDISIQENSFKLIAADGNNINHVLQEMITHNIPILKVSCEHRSLEDIFLTVTGNETIE